MAKKTMMKKQVKKRERNKVKEEYKEKDIAVSFVKNLIGVCVFVGVVYAAIIGLKYLGVFEEGYKKPEAGATTISYKDILIGTVFNRPEETYYVLFDTFGNDTNNVYIEGLTNGSLNYSLYKVDMSDKYNKKYISDTSNTNPESVQDLKINGITLMKINNGKVAKYVTGSEDIESYLKENTKQ